MGHGGLPKDCPAQLVSRFKRLKSECGGRPSRGLKEAEAAIRAWPRTLKNDPYKPGLEAVAAALRRKLSRHLVLAAYGEFCAPSLEEAAEQALERGARQITVVSTMYTRGGFHSETEIPRAIDALRRRHPNTSFRYAWPYELASVAAMLAGQIRRAEESKP